MEKTITLAHGAGGKQTNELIGGIFKKYFDNKYLTADDAAVLPPPTGRMQNSLAVTSESSRYAVR